MNQRSLALAEDEAVSEGSTAVPIDRRRLAVIIEARGWLRTPYHHMGRVKGCGTDCLMLLAEVYERAGVVPRIDVPFYAPDWNLHRDAERYLGGLMQYAREVEGSPRQATSWSLNSAGASPTGRSSLPGRGSSTRGGMRGWSMAMRTSRRSPADRLGFSTPFWSQSSDDCDGWHYRRRIERQAAESGRITAIPDLAAGRGDSARLWHDPCHSEPDRV